MTKEKHNHFAAAANYIAECCKQKPEKKASAYPINRGDLMVLAALLSQEMADANPVADLKRLVAIHDKLGDLVSDTPQMTKEEAELFR